MASIQLENPITTGLLDNNKTYTHVRIVRFIPDFKNKKYILDLEYLDSNGISGRVHPDKTVIMNNPRSDPPGTDFDDANSSKPIALASGTHTAGQQIDDAEDNLSHTIRNLYAFVLLSHPGTIVSTP